MNKSAVSSQPERLTRKSEADIRKYARSGAAREASKRLAARGPEPTARDLKEIPKLTSGELNALYRPVKTPVTVRLDSDIVSWLKAKGGRYQTHLNAVLRHVMVEETKR